MSTHRNKDTKIDANASKRKKDHIDLAFRSKVLTDQIDPRFNYEPMIKGHPQENPITKSRLAHFELDLPIWVSSMTGGTEWAYTINTNLARACGKFGMGMGLGSCRSLLYDDSRLADFTIKKYMPSQPLFANLGIAQIEELVQSKRIDKITDLVSKLDADGLIIHVNPLQEWLQPEGDRYYQNPIHTIQRILDSCPEMLLIIKEVGQGFGPQSIKALYDLPLTAIEYGASGGTNFAMLELLRSSDENFEDLHYLSKIGHSAFEMIELTNNIVGNRTDNIPRPITIVSGGIHSFLDGYFAIKSIHSEALYGQASSLLKYSRESYEKLEAHIERQVKGLEIAYNFLTIK